MKEFRITILVHTEDNFEKSDFILQPHDVIDGFELTRTTDDDDITSDFKLKDAYIEKTEEITKRGEMIKRIKEIMKEWGNTTSAELELESSPCITSIGNNKNNVSALIEGFHQKGVSVYVYQDQNELDSYELPYDDLDDNILEEVAEIIENYDMVMYKTMRRCES